MRLWVPSLVGLTNITFSLVSKLERRRGQRILFFSNSGVGLHRGAFVDGDRRKAEITGLELTQINNVLVSSSLDGTIKVGFFFFFFALITC